MLKMLIFYKLCLFLPNLKLKKYFYYLKIVLHLLGKVKSTDIIEASGNRQVVSSGLYTSLPLTDDLSCLFVT